MADIRVPLTDKTIAQLPAPKEGWYLARDIELKGFFVVIGKRRRTFTVQGDLRRAANGLHPLGFPLAMPARCRRERNPRAVPSISPLSYCPSIKQIAIWRTAGH